MLELKKVTTDKKIKAPPLNIAEMFPCEPDIFFCGPGYFREIIR